MSFDRNLLFCVYKFRLALFSAQDWSFDTFSHSFLDSMTALGSVMDYWTHEFLGHSFLDFLSPPWHWGLWSDPEAQLQITDDGVARLLPP
jgi:hypothetical protein